MSSGKHRRRAKDPVPDAKNAGEYPGGKHADRPATTSPMVPEDASHQEPSLQGG